MATLGDSSASNGPWSALGQASSVAQLVGVDALGLVSMVVQAALAARRHRDACRRLAQHVEIVGGLLRELELSEMMRREATRRPLEQLGGALRRCYALVKACQDCGGFLHRLLRGAWMAEELRAAEREIDMFIRLVPLIALVDTSHDRRAKAMEGVTSVVTSCSNLLSRISGRAEELTNVSVQGAAVPCKVGEQLLEDYSGIVDQHEQKVMDVEELVKFCTSTEATCPGFKSFDFCQIVDGTDNFSDRRIVGKGGFGTVYKAQFTDGTMVAIKRLEEHASDFNGELELATLHHVNLIRLLGWCVHGKERILVYEFMLNGSLDNIIFDRTKGALLNWYKRFQIIKGIAKGLIYMHKHSLCIIHGDLKPNNVLLNGNMSPKIADFGSARTLSSDISSGRTRRIEGTSGYMAPEYASRGFYSVKTDVFSFGVLALVIISGRKNRILEQQGDAVGNLVRDAWQMWKDGRLHELVDPLLSDDGYEIVQTVRCAHVALLCAQEDPTDRPTMSDVVALLSFESTSLLPDPKPPSELIKRDTTDDKFSTYIGQSSMTIDITIASSAPLATRLRIIVEPGT